MAAVNPASMGANESITSVSTDRQGGAFNETPQTAKLLADTVGIPARATDIPRAFPGLQNFPLFAASASAAASRTTRGDNDESGAAGARGGYGDDDDDEIGAVGPRGDNDDEGDDDGDDDGEAGGGGGGGLLSFLSRIPILGSLLGMFSSALSRSRASGGCSGGDCSQRMAMRSRVPSLSNHAASPGYNTPLSYLTPGFGPLGNNKSS